MTTYAGHLEGIGEILSAVRQAEGVATDIVRSGVLGGPYGFLARKREAHAAFMKAYGDATVEGISDEDDARDLLRDAVNLALDLARAYVGRAGVDQVLIRRANDIREEFKPGFGRHGGLSVGDRVEQRGSRGLVSGEVIELSETDGNLAIVRADDDGREAYVACNCCTQVPTFRRRVEHAPAPTM